MPELADILFVSSWLILAITFHLLDKRSIRKRHPEVPMGKVRLGIRGER